MSETIMVAILSLIGTLLGTLGGIIASSKLTNFRIQQLEKKVEEHNKVVERMYRLETRVAVDEEEIDHLKKHHNN